ncbi:hypothetical protein ACFC0C_37575 [Streptomyces sp. NPDC056178]|uniref:hypothetical protein n=1 Tax=unclassified Streptomyces TaxID=2593676 RepID=UPI0035DFBCD3
MSQRSSKSLAAASTNPVYARISVTRWSGTSCPLTTLYERLGRLEAVPVAAV